MVIAGAVVSDVSKGARVAHRAAADVCAVPAGVAAANGLGFVDEPGFARTAPGALILDAGGNRLRGAGQASHF